MSNRVSSMFVLAAFAGLATSASAQTLRNAVKVIAEGDVIPNSGGLIVDTTNDPYTDGFGRVGFTGGALDAGGGTVNYVWYDSGAAFIDTDALPDVLSGAEGTMGVSNQGGFIYSPSFNGDDAVWTQAGLLLADGQPAPGFAGKFNTFNSRPIMAPNGAAFWVAGNGDTSGGGTNQRVFYRVANPASPVFEPLVIGGNTYAGLATTAQGIQFSYDVSDDGSYRIHEFINTGGSATDRHVVLFGPGGAETLLAQEGFPVPGTGDGYVAFRIPQVNNAGDHVIAADTNGATTADEVVVVNSVVRLREGNVVADGTAVGGSINAISVNNCGKVAMIWSNPESLYYGTGSALQGTARRLLAVGDQVDFDGDTVCDAVVADLNASSTIAPGLDLAEDGMVYVSVDLTPCAGGTAFEAIIGVRAECRADWDGSGFADTDDFDAFVASFEAGDADIDCSGFTDTDDFDFFVALFEKGC